MKISRIEAIWLQVPIPENLQHTSDFGRAQTFDTAVVRVETNAGLTGWGEAKVSAGSFGDYGGVVNIINHEFAPRLVGEDPRDITRLWEELYNGTRAHYALARGHVFPAIGRRGVSISALIEVNGQQQLITAGSGVACRSRRCRALTSRCGTSSASRSAPRCGACSAGGVRNACRHMPRAAGRTRRRSVNS